MRRRAKKAGDAGPEEIEEGAAWGESAAPPVEQDKKKKEPEGNACAWRVGRERRERFSLFLTRKRFVFFYRYARRKSSPKGVSPSFGHPPNSRNVRRFYTLVWHTIWHTFALHLHKLLIMKGERAEGIEPS